MTSPKFTPAGSLFTAWELDLATGVRPPTYPLGDGNLAVAEFGPGRVLLIGGAPGAGKTAFVMQAVFHMLASVPDLKAVVCNVEMAPRTLLERQLARAARVNLRDIRRRDLDPEKRSRVAAGLGGLRPPCDRLCFVEPPYTLDHAARVAHAFGAGVVVLDYIQRIKPPGRDTTGEKRLQLEAAMDAIRGLADAGLAVVVVAAVARSKDAKGRNSYGNLSLASFRESSELEYGADDAFILAASDSDPSVVRLAHLKSRYGETGTFDLRFEGAYQTFSPSGVEVAPPVPMVRTDPGTTAGTAPKPTDRFHALLNGARPASERKR